LILSGGLSVESGARLWIPALDGALASADAKAAPGEPCSLFLAPSAPADVAISLCGAFAPPGAQPAGPNVLPARFRARREGVEELETQVVKLLSFEPIPQKVFDTQVGFNMLPAYGEESSENLEIFARGSSVKFETILPGGSPCQPSPSCKLRFFYSHAFTAYAEFKAAPVVKGVVAQLKNAGLKVADADDPPPTNVSVAGEARPVVGQPEADPGIETGVWL